MPKEITKASKWLARARKLSLMCLNRARVNADRIPRFSPNDEEHDIELSRQAMELDIKISSQLVKLQKLESDNLGINVLLPNISIPTGVRNALAYMAMATTWESFALETRTIGSLIEIACGWHTDDALLLKQAISVDGYLRPYVIYKPKPLITECLDPCLTEEAFSKLLGVDICVPNISRKAITRTQEARR